MLRSRGVDMPKVVNSFTTDNIGYWCIDLCVVTTIKYV